MSVRGRALSGAGSELKPRGGTKLAEDQDRVAGAGAGQQSGNQDVSIDTDG
jgi:hypothetical protein